MADKALIEKISQAELYIQSPSSGIFTRSGRGGLVQASSGNLYAITAVHVLEDKPMTYQNQRVVAIEDINRNRIYARVAASNCAAEELIAKLDNKFPSVDAAVLEVITPQHPDFEAIYKAANAKAPKRLGLITAVPLEQYNRFQGKPFSVKDIETRLFQDQANYAYTRTDWWGRANGTSYQDIVPKTGQFDHTAWRTGYDAKGPTGAWNPNYDHQIQLLPTDKKNWVEGGDSGSLLYDTSLGVPIGIVTGREKDGRIGKATPIDGAVTAINAIEAQRAAGNRVHSPPLPARNAPACTSPTDWRAVVIDKTGGIKGPLDIQYDPQGTFNGIPAPLPASSVKSAPQK